MDQDPKVTLRWALRSLERALQNLNDGWAERRVRRQFHQLLLAIERDEQLVTDQAVVKLADQESLRRSVRLEQDRKGRGQTCSGGSSAGDIISAVKRNKWRRVGTSCES